MPGNRQGADAGGGDIYVDSDGESRRLLSTHSVGMARLNALYGKPRKIWVPPSSSSSSPLWMHFSNGDRHTYLTGYLSSASSSPFWPSMPSMATSRSSRSQIRPSCTLSPIVSLSRPGFSLSLPLLSLWRSSSSGLCSFRHLDTPNDLAGRRES